LQKRIEKQLHTREAAHQLKKPWAKRIEAAHQYEPDRPKNTENTVLERLDISTSFCAARQVQANQALVVQHTDISFCKCGPQ